MRVILSYGKHFAFPAIACLFVLVRVWNAYPVVFPETGEIRLSGVDSYFHLRHAQFSATNFTRLLRYDPGSHYPTHGRQSFTGLFNLATAAGAIIGSGFQPTEDAVARTAAWTPVVLAFLALWSLFLLARFFGGTTTGLIACLVFTIYPGSSLSRSLLGFSDQHVAEFLLAFLSMAGLVYCLDRTANNPERKWWQPSLVYAAPFAALFYTWIGAPVYIAVMAVAVFVLLLLATIQPTARTPIGFALFRYFSAVAVWQVLVLLIWPELIIELEPNMRWWNLAGVVFLATAPAAFLAGVDWAERHGAKPQSIAVGSIVVFGMAAFLFFTQIPEGRVFYRWLIGVRALDVAEQQSISVARIWSLLGPVSVLALLSIPLIFRKKAATNRNRWAVVPIVFGSTVTLLWLQTNDFDYLSPIFLALMAALTVKSLDVFFRTRVGIKRPFAFMRWNTSLGVILAAVIILPIWPLRVVQPPWLPTSLIEQSTLHKNAWFDAMRWMRENTPEPTITPLTAIEAEYENPYPEGSYGVLAAWDYGNFIASHGQRPPVSSQYPTAQSAQWMMASSESEAEAFLCPGCRFPERVRYVVLNVELISTLFIAKAQLAGIKPLLQQEGYWNYQEIRVPHITLGSLYTNALVTQLYRGDGKGLSHYRLMYESEEEQLVHYLYNPASRSVIVNSLPIYSDDDRETYNVLEQRTLSPLGDSFIYDAQIVPDIKIYEVVNGAHIVGESPAGSHVILSLELESATTKRTFIYEQSTIADSTSRYSFTVPYATKHNTAADTADIRALGPYRISFSSTQDNQPSTVHVTEEDVQKGKRIVVAD